MLQRRGEMVREAVDYLFLRFKDSEGRIPFFVVDDYRCAHRILTHITLSKGAVATPNPRKIDLTGCVAS
jgi:hypothetical protein